MSYIRLVFLLTILLSSCNPEDIQFPSWQSEWIIPILDVDFDFKDITLSDSILTTDENGLISFVYKTTDTIGTFEELFPFTNQELLFALPGISGVTDDFSAEIGLGSQQIGLTTGHYDILKPFTANENLTLDLKDQFLGAQFEDGRLSLTLTNNFPFTINSGMSLSLNVVDNVLPIIEFTTIYDIAPNETVYLEAVYLQEIFLSGEISIVIENFKSEGGANLTILESDELNFKFVFENIVYDRAIVKSMNLNFIPSVLDLPFSFPTGALISSLSIDAGLMSINIPDYQETGLVMNFDVLSATQKNNSFIIPVGKKEVNLNLDNFILDLTKSYQPYNILSISVDVDRTNTEYVEVNFDQELTGAIKLSSLDYGYLLGYFGFAYDIIEGNTTMDLFSRVYEGKLIFENPSISFSIYNTQGISGAFFDDGNGLFIKGKNPRLFPGEEIAIGQFINHYTFNGPSLLGDFENTTIKIDKSTEPDFGEFIALMPTEIDYRIPVRFGTENVDLNQFIYDKGIVAYDLSVELPLELAAENLSLSDTVPLIAQFEYEEIEIVKAALTAKITNHFPIQLNVQIYFLDENYNVIDSLFSIKYNVQNAELNDLGIVIKPYEVIITLEITKEKLENIKQAAYSAPVFNLVTPSQQNVKILSTYTTNLKLTGEIYFDVDLN